MSVTLLNAEAASVAAEPARDRWPACRGVLVIAGLSGGLWWAALRVVGWVLS